MREPVTNRGLLRAALALALALSGLSLIRSFLADIATAALVLLMGLLLAVALSGPVEALHGRKVPRGVASFGVLSGILAVLGLVVYLSVSVLAEQFGQVVSALPFAFSQVDGWIERLAGRLNLPFDGGGGPSLSTLISWGRRLVGGALGLFGSLTTLVFGLIVAFFVPLYLAANPGPVVDWTLRLLPPDRRRRARSILSEVRRNLLEWLKGRLLSMTIVGVLWAGSLYLIGIPGSLFLGILAGLLEFLPYLGPIVSTVPPVLLAFAGDPSDVLWVLLSYTAIQQVQGYLLKPLVEGRVVSLHPAVVIASVAVAGAAFGFLGVLLAVPATVVAKVLVEELWFRRLEGDPGGWEEEPVR